MPAAEWLLFVVPVLFVKKLTLKVVQRNADNSLIDT